MSYENTQRRAYAIWEKEGRPEGRHLRNWEQAVGELFGMSDQPSRLRSQAERPTSETPSGTKLPPSKASR
jgi:hypothetical protein